MPRDINTASDNTANSLVTKPTDASETLMQAALTFYPCKNGALVRDPKDCSGTMNSSNILPDLTIQF